MTYLETLEWNVLPIGLPQKADLISEYCRTDGKQLYPAMDNIYNNIFLHNKSA